jgi:hypothetical protein
MNRRWTPDDDRRLRLMHTAGWSLPRVMAALGRTQNAVYARSQNMGLGPWGRAVRLPPAGTLAEEIEAALRERATSPLFRPGDRV